MAVTGGHEYFLEKGGHAAGLEHTLMEVEVVLQSRALDETGFRQKQASRRRRCLGSGESRCFAHRNHYYSTDGKSYGVKPYLGFLAQAGRLKRVGD